MTALTVSLCLWGLFTMAFVFLVLYRGYLSENETDRLFLSETELSPAHWENDEIIRRSESIEPICKGLGGAAILLTLVVAGVWITQMLSTAQII